MNRCERCGRIGPHPSHEVPSDKPRGRGWRRAQLRRAQRAQKKTQKKTKP